MKIQFDGHVCSTEQDCRLPDGSAEEVTRAMFSHLTGVGALEILNDG